jgi:hypothetical protein
VKLNIGSIRSVSTSVIAANCRMPAEFVPDSVSSHGNHEGGQLIHRFDPRPVNRYSGEKAAKNDLADVERIDQIADPSLDQSRSDDAAEDWSKQLDKLRRRIGVPSAYTAEPLWESILRDHSATPES